jgi:hypothetical protein
MGWAGGGPGLWPIERVVLAVKAHSRGHRPHETHQLDGLLQSVDSFCRVANRPSHGLDCFWETAGPEPELDPASADHIQTRRGLGEHGGRAQLQIGHIRHEVDHSGQGDECRHQGPGVEEAALVGMILDPDELQAGTLDRPSGRRRSLEIGHGVEVAAEFDIPKVIGQLALLVFGPPAR